MENKNYINQSGIVPYYIDKGIKRIILITAKNPRKNWIVPKGHVEKGSNPQQAAVKEAFEEAGIKGNIISKIIGSFYYKKNDKEYKVDYYPFEVTEILDDWPERKLRERISVEQGYSKKYIFDEKLLEILLQV